MAIAALTSLSIAVASAGTLTLSFIWSSFIFSSSDDACGNNLNRACQKRIGQSFLADRRSWSMAADKGDVVAEWQQLLDDRTDQLLMAAVWCVGAPDRALKQDVANMGELQLVGKEHDAARRMTRAMENLELELADLDVVALVEPTVRRNIALAL